MIAATAAALTLVCMNPTVVDGDTIRDCQGERVRLFGLDAPELDQPGGLLARDQLRRLTEGRVTCTVQNPRKPRDKYRRLVMMCENQSGDVACQMIRSGPSVEYERYSNGYYANCKGNTK